MGVVVVEPVDLVVGHDGGLEQGQVEREQGGGAELIELSELGLAGRNDLYQVLAAYAVLVGQVDAGLVAGHHAGLQRSGVDVQTDILRTLVAVDEEAYAVAGAVVIGFALVPEELARQDIQLVAGGAGGEDSLCQGDVTLHHQGEVMLHGLGGGADGYGAGDVGGAALVLAAAVNEQQAIPLDDDVGLLGGLVVHDGAVAVEA